MSKDLKKVYQQLVDTIEKSNDVDVVQLFSECPLKSPVEKDKRRTDRIEIEESYINVCLFHWNFVFPQP